MREYGQVQCNFWVHPDIQSLSDQAKLLALYLIEGPHSNALGCYRLPIGYVSADLGWSSETVSKRFAELFQAGLVIRDEATSWILLQKFLRWNPIANPNVGKNVAKCVEAIPRNISFANELCHALRQHGHHLPNSFDTVLESFRIPEPNLTYPEPKPEPEPTTPRSGETPNDDEMLTPEGLRQKWNERKPDELPRVEKLSDGRLKRCKAALKQRPQPEFWDGVLAEYVRSIWLRTLGDGHVTRDFDWLISTGRDGIENFEKVAAGRYRDRSPPGPNSSGPGLSETAQYNLAAGEEAKRLIRERIHAQGGS